MQARRVAGVPLWAPLLALAMWLAILAYRAEADPSLRPWSVLTLWLASLVVFLASAYAVPKGQVRCRASPRWSKLEVVALLGFVIAALLVRTIALDRVPQSFGGDEAELGIQARAVLYGELRDPFTTGWAGHPTVWSFVQAASLGVFGDDVFGVRMIAALLGAATVPLLYVFARRSYGRELALVAATLLTTYQLHVHYSRIGVNSVGDAFWLLLGLVLLLEGLRRASPLLMASAGVSAGLAQHFYLGSRLRAARARERRRASMLVNRAAVRPSVRYLPLAALGFLLGYGPGVRVPLYHWEEYNARISQVGISNPGGSIAAVLSGTALSTSLGISSASLSAPSRTSPIEPSTTCPRCRSSTPFRRCSSSSVSSSSRSNGVEPSQERSSPGSSGQRLRAAFCSSTRPTATGMSSSRRRCASSSLWGSCVRLAR